MRLCFRFPADTVYLEPIREFGAKLLHIWLPSTANAEEAEELHLAVQEAVTNVIRHSYQGKNGLIEIEFRFLDQQVEVEIRDWGKSFDPQSIPLPNFESPTPGGYGLFIMRKVMDHLEYRHEGNMNIVHLIKKFSKSSKIEESS